MRPLFSHHKEIVLFSLETPGVTLLNVKVYQKPYNIVYPHSLFYIEPGQTTCLDSIFGLEMSVCDMIDSFCKCNTPVK